MISLNWLIFNSIKTEALHPYQKYKNNFSCCKKVYYFTNQKRISKIPQMLLSLKKQWEMAPSNWIQKRFWKDCLQGCGMVGASLEISKEKCNDRETATTWSSCQPLTERQTWNDNCTEWTAVGGPADRNYASGWKTATQSDPSQEQARDTRTLPSWFPSLASVLLVGSNRNPEHKEARLFRTHWAPPGLAIRGKLRAAQDAQNVSRLCRTVSPEWLFSIIMWN